LPKPGKRFENPETAGKEKRPRQLLIKRKKALRKA
jgi:hypothetical protein